MIPRSYGRVACLQPSRCIVPRWTYCNAQPNTVGNPPSYSAICRNAPNISVFPCSGRSGVGAGAPSQGRGTPARSPARGPHGRVRFLPIHPVGGVAREGMCRVCTTHQCGGEPGESGTVHGVLCRTRARMYDHGNGVPARRPRFGHWGATGGRGAPRGSLRGAELPSGLWWASGGPRGGVPSARHGAELPSGRGALARGFRGGAKGCSFPKPLCFRGVRVVGRFFQFYSKPTGNRANRAKCARTFVFSGLDRKPTDSHGIQRAADCHTAKL